MIYTYYTNKCSFTESNLVSFLPNTAPVAIPTPTDVAVMELPLESFSCLDAPGGFVVTVAVADEDCPGGTVPVPVLITFVLDVDGFEPALLFFGAVVVFF